MRYGYIRVSSDKQTVENQRFEINAFCAKEGWKVDGWIEETVSGTAAYRTRQLGRLLLKVKKGDMIICSELSRLGRNLYMIMEILGVCMARGCYLWTIKDGYRLGDDIQSKVLAFAFGLSAEIERNLISDRTREAMARLKAEGKPVGRPKGRKTCRELSPVYAYEDYVRQALEQGVSKRAIAQHLHCGRNTLNRYISEFMES